MSKIDNKTVEKIADLAKIDLTNAEIDKFAGEIDSILEYVEKLKEIETDEIDYESHVELNNVMDEDETRKSLDTDVAIGQARTKGKYVSVPSVL